MKRLFVITLLAIGGFWGSAQASEGDTFNKVFEQRSLHCGTFVFNNLYEPALEKGGEANGFFADVMREVAARLQIKLSIGEISSFATGFEEVKSGRFDMLCASLASHAVNYDKMLFTTALFYDPIFPYGDAKRDYSDIKSRADINQEKWRIAGMDGELGGYYGPIVFPMATMHMVPQNSAVGMIMSDMFTNKADMVLITEAAAKAYMDANPGTLKKLIDEPIAMYPVRFVFRPGDERLQSVFNNVFEDLRAEGVIERLLQENHLK